MAFIEVKECCKGHQDLGSKLRGEETHYAAKRFVNRILSDAYGRGVVRGQVENTNLRAYQKESDVTFAECIKTCSTESFFGKEFADLEERMVDKSGPNRHAVFGEVDSRQKRRKVRIKNVAIMYGHRSVSSKVWTLSPYEFAMYYEFVQPKLPKTLAEISAPWVQVVMSPSGHQKLKMASEECELVAGEDYEVKTDLGESYVLFDKECGIFNLRHMWIMKRRQRPVCPMFHGAPVPRREATGEDRAARLAMSYFHPWTLCQQAADDHVRYVGYLRQKHMSWQESLTEWLDGNVVGLESVRYIGNFLSVYRVRPADPEDDAHSDEDVSDEELILQNDDEVDDALKTKLTSKENALDADDLSDGDEANNSTVQGMHHIQSLWTSECRGGYEVMGGNWTMPQDSLETCLQAAKKSQRQERTLNEHVANAAKTKGSITRGTSQATVHEIREWVALLPGRCRADGKPLLNSKQVDMVTKIGERIIVELEELETGTLGESEPLRWCLHGGPGTGKSFVLNLVKKELFQEKLGWRIGDEFQIVALQAVMAQMLGGDTIHHALGIPACSAEVAGEDVANTSMNIAKKVLQLRWLFIDEISMVSSKLLAEVDCKTRSVVREICPTKSKTAGHARSFGGLNVVLSGDWWQLEPPEGGFLAQVPTEYIANARKFHPLPTTAHGQALLWGGKEMGVQGVTELVEVERVKDLWVQEIQAEFRNGHLSDDNWRFLHGMPTEVPGSTVQGVALCGNGECQQIIDCNQQDGDQYDALQVECEDCKKERQRRCRVLNMSDEIDLPDSFELAPCIFATNNLKYEANKLRAKKFACSRNKLLVYVKAEDKPTPQAIQERPDLPAKKREWLKRHDRDCGKLYGMLPLCDGMPVTLTDHIDRSPDKALLRGRRGYVHSWIEHQQEASKIMNGRRVLQKLPLVVFVQFYDIDEHGDEVLPNWRIPGTDRNGVYPIIAKKADWFLDQGRQYRKLKIKRRQIPLAPAFAMTAHASQGQTFSKGCIVDLEIGGKASPLAAYVGLTRITKLERLMILRPFKKEPFQKRVGHGRELLLKHLRDEIIDWKEVEDMFMPRKQCGGCNFSKYSDSFTKIQWARKAIAPFCKECVRARTQAGTPLQCTFCTVWKSENAFEETERAYQNDHRRVCKTCVPKYPCAKCGEHLPRTEFSQRVWDAAMGVRGLKERTNARC